MIDKITFARKLKKLRKSTGLSQSLFATTVGVNKRTLQGWEGGRPLDYPDLIYEALLQRVERYRREKNRRR